MLAQLCTLVQRAHSSGAGGCAGGWRGCSRGMGGRAGTGREYAAVPGSGVCTAAVEGASAPDTISVGWPRLQMQLALASVVADAQLQHGRHMADACCACSCCILRGESWLLEVVSTQNRSAALAVAAAAAGVWRRSVEVGPLRLQHN